MKNYHFPTIFPWFSHGTTELTPSPRGCSAVFLAERLPLRRGLRRSQFSANFTVILEILRLKGWIPTDGGAPQFGDE